MKKLLIVVLVLTLLYFLFTIIAPPIVDKKQNTTTLLPPYKVSQKAQKIYNTTLSDYDFIPGKTNRGTLSKRNICIWLVYSQQLKSKRS